MGEGTGAAVATRIQLSLGAAQAGIVTNLEPTWERQATHHAVARPWSLRRHAERLGRRASYDRPSDANRNCEAYRSKRSKQVPVRPVTFSGAHRATYHFLMTIKTNAIFPQESVSLHEAHLGRHSRDDQRKGDCRNLCKAPRDGKAYNSSVGQPSGSCLASGAAVLPMQGSAATSLPPGDADATRADADYRDTDIDGLRRWLGDRIIAAAS